MHGLSVDEALNEVRNALSRHDWKRSNLVFITGKGNHSQGGKPKIKPAVTQYLKKKKYR